MITDRTFQLLAELDGNNNKEWFDAHREEVRHFVQNPFEGLLEMVSTKLADAELPLSGGRQTTFRMNRDVRFSADKRPYNSHVSGVLTPSGTKSEKGGLVYVHLGPDGGFLAGGHYKLPPKELGPIRDRIVERPDAFRRVLDDLADAGLKLCREVTLKSMPQGYADHADAWFAEHLKLQAYFVRRDLGLDEWKSDAVARAVARFAQDCAGLIRFGER